VGKSALTALGIELVLDARGGCCLDSLLVATPGFLVVDRLLSEGGRVRSWSRRARVPRRDRRGDLEGRGARGVVPRAARARRAARGRTSDRGDALARPRARAGLRATRAREAAPLRRRLLRARDGEGLRADAGGLAARLERSAHARSCPLLRVPDVGDRGAERGGRVPATLGGLRSGEPSGSWRW
jgi:hypothetical protein